MTESSTPPVASPPTLSVAETMVTSLCADPSNVDLPTVMAIPGDGEETPEPMPTASAALAACQSLAEPG